jgi:hypothetical protein
MVYGMAAWTGRGGGGAGVKASEAILEAGVAELVDRSCGA